jgi:hypothetical protein
MYRMREMQSRTIEQAEAEQKIEQKQSRTIEQAEEEQNDRTM